MRSQVSTAAVDPRMLTRFAHPGLNSIGRDHAACLRGQVLSVGTERSTAVDEVAVTSPALRGVGELVAPGQGVSAVLCPLSIVGLQPVIAVATTAVRVVLDRFRTGRGRG